MRNSWIKIAVPNPIAHRTSNPDS